MRKTQPTPSKRTPPEITRVIKTNEHDEEEEDRTDRKGKAPMEARERLVSSSWRQKGKSRDHKRGQRFVTKLRAETDTTRPKPPL